MELDAMVLDFHAELRSEEALLQHEATMAQSPRPAAGPDPGQERV